MYRFDPKLHLVSALLAVSIGCAKEEEDEETEFDIPAVTATCTTPATACVDGSAADKSTVIYWSNTVCADSDTAGEIKAGNAVATTCADGTCTAVISTWETFDGAAVAKLEEGNYYLCAGIDLDESGDLNQAGEPVAIEQVEFKEGIGAQVVDAFVDQTVE